MMAGVLFVRDGVKSNNCRSMLQMKPLVLAVDATTSCSSENPKVHHSSPVAGKCDANGDDTQAGTPLE